MSSESNTISNIPISIKSKIGKNIYMQHRHPIQLIKQKIFDYFSDEYAKIENLDPKVSIVDNFDLLLIPPDHPSRSKSDTFYVDANTVLRTHTSAHQNELLSRGIRKFLVVGDVYRKDEIDSSHYPIFHQMEGVCIVDEGESPEDELKKILSGLVRHLFPDKEYRFNKDYFPFTDPSYEIEVKFGDKWLEILGCGVIRPKILEHCNVHGKGWAFGLGLERLAMILFDIPDIRLFWSDEEKFLSQFEKYDDVKFVPYSKLDKVYKDISFWINPDEICEEGEDKYKWSNLNTYFSLIREIAGDNIEKVDLYDKFLHPKTSKVSHTFRLTFSPNKDLKDPSEFESLCNGLMATLREETSKLNVVLR
jgi:phenylalanyl-tRNA synthetase alpha chain